MKENDIVGFGLVSVRVGRVETWVVDGGVSKNNGFMKKK